MIDADTIPTVRQTHIVSCFHCSRTFDTVSAAFCACIARERTFACAHCGQCACAASYKQRNEFWIAAPPSLHVRKRTEKQDGVVRLQSTDRNAIRRPFALIVDDDPLVLGVAERAVRGMGFSTLVTRSPEEAFEIAVALVPDLVLTDALMPRLDGRELCARLKSCDITRRVKVVVMSALYRGTVYRNQAFKTFGVDEYLAKPIRPAVLRDALARVMPHVTLAAANGSGDVRAAS